MIASMSIYVCSVKEVVLWENILESSTRKRIPSTRKLILGASLLE